MTRALEWLWLALWWAAVAVMAAALLVGCTTPKPAVVEPTWTAEQVEDAARRAYEIGARQGYAAGFKAGVEHQRGRI